MMPPQVPPREEKTHTSATICLRSLSVILSKFNSFRANTYEESVEAVSVSHPHYTTQRRSTNHAVRLPPDLSDDTKGAISNDIQRLVQI